jgi:hypothetical protein
LAEPCMASPRVAASAAATFAFVLSCIRKISCEVIDVS